MLVVKGEDRGTKHENLNNCNNLKNNTAPLSSKNVKTC